MSEKKKLQDLAEGDVFLSPVPGNGWTHDLMIVLTVDGHYLVVFNLKTRFSNVWDVHRSPEVFQVLTPETAELIARLSR